MHFNLHLNLISFSIFIFIVLIKDSEEVFRFCYRGSWHELKEDDCPYGLLFPEKIDTPCFYTQGVDNTTARIWPTICGDPFVNEKEETGILGDDFILAQKNGVLQMVQYGITEPADKLPIWDDVVDISTCEDQCYMSLDTSGVPPSRSSHEAGDSNEENYERIGEIDETQKMAITDQTLRLGDYLFDELNTEEQNRRAEEPSSDLRIVTLYKKTIKILGKTCPHPFVPEDFRNRIASGFLFLVTDTGVGEMDDIEVEEFEEIMTALKTCEDKYPTFRLEGTVCSMKTVVDDIIKILPDGEELTASYKPADWDKNKTAFPYKQYDPFTEFAWQAVTVTHASCFANFKPNANMHHKYTSAMERLFGEKLRFRWENPTQLEDSRMWGTWFLADLDSTHLNMGACITGAYEGAPFSLKLDRPIDKTRRTGRRKRDADSVDEPPTENALGQGPLNANTFWDTYKSSGGIKENLAGEVQCFQTQEKQEFVLKGLKDAVCTSEEDTSFEPTDEPI